APKVARKVGVGELWVKDEGVNPTGTFKARGASASISRWKELGVTRFAQPTVGSGGHAWAAYRARAGVEIHAAVTVDCPDLGWMGSKRPRLVSVQVGGGAVVKAFHEGLDECSGAKHVDTIAPGIMVVKPFSDFLILRALRATNGWAVGVPDDEIRHFMAWVNR